MTVTQNRPPIASLSDLLVLALLTALAWLGYQHYAHPRPCAIPDKVEVRLHQPPSPAVLRRDIQLAEAELSELDYYLRVHTVTDEGYNLVAQYHTALQRRLQSYKSQLVPARPTPFQLVTRDTIPAKNRLLPSVPLSRGYWRAARFHILERLSGPAVLRDHEGRIVSALYSADTIVRATRRDSLGTYRGQMNRHLQASGQGTLDTPDGAHYEGFFRCDQRHGFGFESSPHRAVRIGEWKHDRFLGERMQYTAERIYGIDISRYQHEQGRRRFAINWRQLRITSLGHRHPTAAGQTFPVSFIYIKATESTTIRNRYFAADYAAARRHGIHVGAYHFFSLKTTPQAQAAHFLRNARIQQNDFPPVLDVEPTDAQIASIGGDAELMRRICTFLQIVEQRTQKRPILYVSQNFINRHMQHAADIKQRYNVWIARYGEYKPDVRLVYWQLSADGRVQGIHTPVDINVFNGYQSQFDDFLRTGFHQ